MTGRNATLALMTGTILAIGAAAGAQQGGGLAAVGLAPGSMPGTSVRAYVLEQRAKSNPVEGDTAARIIGGQPAQQGSWPAQVSLHARDRIDNDPESLFRSQFCGGTLISRQWVLTAAHCVVNEEGRANAANDVIVRTGSVSLVEGDLRQVARVIVHENYDPILFDNDIALLQLADPIARSSGPVGAIPVHTPGMPFAQDNAVVVGWGLMEGDRAPVNLMQTSIQIVPNEVCNRGMAEQTKRDFAGILIGLGTASRIPEDKLEDAFQILARNVGDALTGNMICAGVPSGAHSSCNGDSGGPLMVRQQDGKWLQVGIVSWGRSPLGAAERCGHENLYAVYTRLSNYFDWISRHVRG